MKNYYFTFGQDHVNNDGKMMRDYWVRVESTSYNAARETFVDEFSSIEMPRPMGWSWQYEEENFDKSFFPAGEYKFIPSEEATNKLT